MRKLVLLLTVLLLGLAAGCGGESASPTVSPTLPSSPTPVPQQASATQVVSVTPSGPAVCVEEPFDFAAEPRIPPVTEEDYVHGPADAPITFIEYADFQ